MWEKGWLESIIKYREQNFPITPDNIYEIPKLRISSALLKCIDFTFDSPESEVNNNREENPSPNPELRDDSATRSRLLGQGFGRGYVDPNREINLQRNSGRLFWRDMLPDQLVERDLNYRQRSDEDERSSETEVSAYRPPVLPRHLQFDGKSSWNLFKQKFTRYAASSGWSMDDKRDAFCWCVSGKAGDYYSLLMQLG